MQLGDIGKIGDVCIDLQYVKVMSYLPTSLGKEDVSNDNEVILAFFELYNGADSSESVDPSSITCYADGTQASDVETYIKVYVDGVHQYYREDLAGKCQLLSVEDFGVSKGWNEIKFFYESDCVWTISQDDFSENDYNKTSLFDVSSVHTTTEQDEVIYSEKYDVQFKEVEIYHTEGLLSDTDYAVFKYRITNNDSEALDTSLMGYEMQAYQNNFYSPIRSVTKLTVLSTFMILIG
jgi:hypothetical protein